jgi:hypothetical protein
LFASSLVNVLLAGRTLCSASGDQVDPPWNAYTHRSAGNIQVKPRARGVVAFLATDESNRTHLTLDDVAVEAHGDGRPQDWRFRSTFTSKQIDTADVAELAANEDLHRDIGMTLLLRLATQHRSAR